tara:strand:- start:21271 stop:21729 length:459 start_codon:yes stop_codon:yes gene_type:complete
MFLVQAKGLPNELESLVFDLWALRVAQLADRIASAYQESDSQSQVFSTLESEESEITDNERGIMSAPRDRDKKLQGAPNLYDCLVLCYLGISTLRLPITPGDIYAWTTDGDMAPAVGDERSLAGIIPCSPRPSDFNATQALLQYDDEPPDQL